MKPRATTAIPRPLRHLLVALLLLVGSTVAPQDLAVDVIVSPSLAKLTLDRRFLRAVFTMRVREWPDGTPIRVFVLPDDDPLSEQFYREQLGMYPYVLRRAWDRMVFTGTGFAPTVLQSEQEMIERVRATPGAIGFVRKRESSSGYRRARPRWMIVLLMKDAND